MLVPGIVAGTLMLAGCAVMSMDTPVGRSALYAFYTWQRRRRARRGGGPRARAPHAPALS